MATRLDFIYFFPIQSLTEIKMAMNVKTDSSLQAEVQS